jgi:hypothetical protein
MKTAILTAVVVFGIAAVISMGVAGLMKFLFLAIRRINASKKA